MLPDRTYDCMDWAQSLGRNTNSLVQTSQVRGHRPDSHTFDEFYHFSSRIYFAGKTLPVCLEQPGSSVGASMSDKLSIASNRAPTCLQSSTARNAVHFHRHGISAIQLLAHIFTVQCSDWSPTGHVSHQHLCTLAACIPTCVLQSWQPTFVIQVSQRTVEL